MKYATVCSGVEAMSMAVANMGWEPVFFSEIEPFPCKLLAHRFTNVHNLGDMTKIEGDKYHGTIDVFAGGTPCQSFSVAGKRGGLGDGRGQLMLHFVKLAYETGARWAVWENVPGCLSSGKGEDFAALLSSLCGVDVSVPAEGWKNSGVVVNAPGCYGVAWRVLDAQYTRVPGFDFAVPQRRRRVWLVGYLGDWRRAAEILFVGEGMPWDFKAGEGAREGVAGGAEDRAGAASGFNFEMFSGDCKGIAPCLQHDRAGDTLTYCMAHGQANAEVMADKSPTLTVLHEAPIVTCYENHANDSRITDSGQLSPTITSRCGTGGGNLPLVKVPPATYFERRMVRTTGGQPQDDVASCLRSDTNSGDGAPCVAIADVVHGDKACNGNGWNDEGAAYTLDTMATQGVCFQQKVCSPLDTKPIICDSNKHLTKEDYHGDAEETRPFAILQNLREEIGEEAFSVWGLGMLCSFQEPEVLFIEMFWGEFEKDFLGRIGHEREDNGTFEKRKRMLRDVWVHGCGGRSPQKQEPQGQQRGELDACLQKLSRETPSRKQNVLDMWFTAQGSRILREALSEIQKIWESLNVKGQPICRNTSGGTTESNKEMQVLRFASSCSRLLRDALHATEKEKSTSKPTSLVRRLLPIETERLMGFPDGWTDIRPNGKPTTDAPRYKACGNSWAVNCARWVMMRIQQSEDKHNRINNENGGNK